MKFLLILFCCFVAVAANGEFVCRVLGNFSCRLQCIAVGHWHGGKCNDDNECVCLIKGDEYPNVFKRSLDPEERASLACRLGGDLACKGKCLMSSGSFKGYCDENKDCVCIKKPADPEGRSDLACKFGVGTCQAFCHWTIKIREGHCDEDGNCVCHSNST